MRRFKAGELDFSLTTKKMSGSMAGRRGGICFVEGNIMTPSASGSPLEDAIVLSMALWPLRAIPREAIFG